MAKRERKREQSGIGLFALLSIAAAGCSDIYEQPPVGETEVTISLDLPLNVKEAQLEESEAVLTNIYTGSKTTITEFVFDGSFYSNTIASLSEGVYDIAVRGMVSYMLDDGSRVLTSVKSHHSNSTMTAHTDSVVLGLNIYNAQEGLLITEIFFTGSLTPQGKQYVDDQYFKVGNNSDSTLFLDGLAFVESDFLTTKKLDISPNLMLQAMTIDAIYCFPGSGHDNPIAPGEEVVVALKAVDHRERNTNSINLATADYEIYDETLSASNTDSDNPYVPNMVNWYNYSKSYFILHNRGYHSYALARPQTDKETFLRDYAYTYNYTTASGEYIFEMTDWGYKLPNTWIVDAVNLSIEASFQWLVTSPVLDAGWTYCGTIENDKTRYGKAVVRKRTDNGKWQKTNNSAADFEPRATPTLFR